MVRDSLVLTSQSCSLGQLVSGLSRRAVYEQEACGIHMYTGISVANAADPLQGCQETGRTE